MDSSKTPSSDFCWIVHIAGNVNYCRASLLNVWLAGEWRQWSEGSTGLALSASDITFSVDKMLSLQSRVLSSSRPSTRPSVASSTVARAPTVVTQASGVQLGPLVDAFKADQLKQDLPQVGPTRHNKSTGGPRHCITTACVCCTC